MLCPLCLKKLPYPWDYIWRPGVFITGESITNTHNLSNIRKKSKPFQVLSNWTRRNCLKLKIRDEKSRCNVPFSNWLFVTAGDSCAAASALGVDLATFASTVAYGTHFILLEDLRSRLCSRLFLCWVSLFTGMRSAHQARNCLIRKFRSREKGLIAWFAEWKIFCKYSLRKTKS